MDVPEPKSPSVAPSGTPPVATVEEVQRDRRLRREDVARLTPTSSLKMPFASVPLQPSRSPWALGFCAARRRSGAARAGSRASFMSQYAQLRLYWREHCSAFIRVPHVDFRQRSQEKFLSWLTMVQHR